MLFTKRLRDGVRRGEITCSVRIWMRPHVAVCRRYRMEEGEIEVDSILPITYADITPAIARASGFKGVVDLLKVAKHGRGENVYLVRFHYVPPGHEARADRNTVTLSCEIERKGPRLPRFFVIPTPPLAPWGLTGTTVVEATLNGVEIGRRTLKPWDADRWFVELSELICRLANVATGDRIRVSLRPASMDLPAELAGLIEEQPRAKAIWAALTASQQRAAKAPETRRRRAERALGRWKRER